MYQKLIIIGNLGRDPEMRYTPDGKAVTTFSVATSRKYNEKEETTWFRVSVWGKQAESCNQYLTKGSKVLVEGRLRPDANTGAHRFFKRKTAVGAVVTKSTRTLFGFCPLAVRATRKPVIPSMTTIFRSNHARASKNTVFSPG